MPTVSRSTLSRPDHSTADCHRSREPFDAAFRVINERRDIGPAAKLVHAHLVTLHRTQRDATQTEIGDALGMSRHQVWRAVCELVAAGIIQTIRYGLGRPNGYVLLGIDQETLDGKWGRATASRPAGGAVAGGAGTPARAYIPPKEKTVRTDISGPDRDYLAVRSHDGADYYATRTGRLSPRTD